MAILKPAGVVVALVVTGLLVLVGLTAGAQYVASGELSRSHGEAVLRLVLTAGAVVVILAVLLLSLLPYRMAWTLSRRSGVDLAGILVGLTIATFLFRDGVISLFGRPLWYGLRASDDLLSVGAAPALTPDSSMTGAELIDRVAGGIAQMTGDVVNAAQDLWAAIALPQVAFALAAWALGASLFARPKDLGTGTAHGWAVHWWKSLAESQRRFLGVMALLGCGAYLSVAAIIAIPWLSGDKGEGQGPTKEQLEAQLQRDTVVVVSASFAQDSVLVENALAGLDEGVSAARQVLTQYPDSATARWTVALDILTAGAADLRRQHRQLLSDARTELVARERVSRQPIADAVSAFETNTSTQMTAAERSAFYQSLVNWVRGELQSWSATINGLVQFAHRQTVIVEAWAADVGSQLRSFGPPPRDSLRTGALPVLVLLPPFLPSAPTISLRDAPRLGVGTGIPDPPEPGLGWGPFALVAQWLLRTRSVPLAQIAGMLGFGLFGAAVSVIRWKDRRSSAALGDVAAVLVNGFSATMVVFLAVNGGLAIASEGQAQPNSYVLFFACVVGAVFSEDVWIWARGKLLDVLEREQGTEDRRASAHATDAAAAPKTTKASRSRTVPRRP